MQLELQQNELLEDIDRLYFNQNFGTLSKSDFELLLFHHYMEELSNKGENRTNYDIAKQLGITVQRVTGLKEKEDCQYPYGEGA